MSVCVAEGNEAAVPFYEKFGFKKRFNVLQIKPITMEDRIKISFDKSINGYVVTMPDFVTLDMIEDWKDRFDQALKTDRNSNSPALLFDTNKHNFESIQCLKSLREYLTDHTVVKQNFSRAALVAPAKFMAPTIKSEVEAYFDNVEDAYNWLKK